MRSQLLCTISYLAGCKRYTSSAASFITAATCKLKVMSNHTLFMYFYTSSVQHSIHFDCKNKLCTIGTSQINVSLHLLGGKYVHICDAFCVLIMHTCNKNM